jgi:isoleucyl-tRNA synthetase
LSEVIIVTRDETDRARASRQEQVILDELNIKSMRFAEDQAEFVAFRVTPDFAKLGPRLGPKMPAVKKAFERADHRALRDSIVSGGTCTVNYDGESMTFTDDEVQVTIESLTGYAAASGSRIAVVLKTDLTPELEAEGVAREIVHHLQGLRKTADLDYQARIIAFVKSDDKSILKSAEKHRDYIMSETLADEMKASPKQFECDYSLDVKVNGVAVTLGISVK